MTHPLRVAAPSRPFVNYYQGLSHVANDFQKRPGGLGADRIYAL